MNPEPLPELKTVAEHNRYFMDTGLGIPFSDQKEMYTVESVHILLETIENRMVKIETWAENIHLGKTSTEHLSWLGLINQMAEKTKEEIREVGQR